MTNPDARKASRGQGQKTAMRITVFAFRRSEMGLGYIHFDQTARGGISLAERRSSTNLIYFPRLRLDISPSVRT